MAICTICNKPITEEDKQNANYRQTLSPGKWRHRTCPVNLICRICNGEIEKGQNAGTKAYPRHADCCLDLPKDSTQANPSSWIIK